MVHELRISFTKNVPTVTIHVLDQPDAVRESEKKSRIEELSITDEDLEQLKRGK